MNKCCFTGHRPKSLPWGYNENSESCKRFKETLKSLLISVIENGTRYFITGMAEGFDTYALETLLEIRNEGYNIIIEGAIPCKNQDLKWSEDNKLRYRRNYTKLDKTTLISSTYTPTCMHERNDYMLNSSNMVISCYKGGYGGTWSTISKARKLNKELININPQSLEITYD